MALGEMSDIRPYRSKNAHLSKNVLETRERRKLGFARRSGFGVISSHSLLLNDQTSREKKIQRDLKVRTKP